MKRYNRSRELLGGQAFDRRCDEEGAARLLAMPSMTPKGVDCQKKNSFLAQEISNTRNIFVAWFCQSAGNAGDRGALDNLFYRDRHAGRVCQTIKI
jgi:hypothetical protein